MHLLSQIHHLLTILVLMGGGEVGRRGDILIAL